MVLNYIWISFFVIAFAIGVVKLVLMGDTGVFPAMIDSTFASSKTAFEISLGLTGVLSLWLGIMKIGECGGVVDALSRLLSPVFTRLFPDIPKGHPATGSIFMNIAANMLGLDNAATPLGLRAMEQLQGLNPRKDTATNPMIMFLVLNTSGLTIIPVSILVYRAQMGAGQPTDVFIPILLATFFSTLAGIVATSIYQRINLLNRTLLLTLFYRLLPTLIKEGKVFIAESPLYEITCKDNIYFAYDENEKAQIVSRLGNAKYTLQRSKGLGENEPDMMWQTTMNPETRRLIKVMEADREKTEYIFETLLGDDLDERKRFIAAYGKEYIAEADI